MKEMEQHKKTQLRQELQAEKLKEQKGDWFRSVQIFGAISENILL